MRWPWQREVPQASPAPARPAERPSPAGWAFHAPLQRMLASEMTVHRGGSAGWTATGRPLGLTTSMSHLVSGAEPSGVVDGDGRGLDGVAPARPGAVPLPAAAEPTAPVGGGLTRAAAAALPVLRYAVASSEMPLHAAPRRPVAGATGDVGQDAELGPEIADPAAGAAHVGAVNPGEGWTNPALAGTGSTVVDIPQPGGQPVEPSPVQRSAAAGRRLGLGAPLTGGPNGVPGPARVAGRPTTPPAATAVQRSADLPLTVPLPPTPPSATSPTPTPAPSAGSGTPPAEPPATSPNAGAGTPLTVPPPSTPAPGAGSGTSAPGAERPTPSSRVGTGTPATPAPPPTSAPSAAGTAAVQRSVADGVGLAPSEREVLADRDPIRATRERLEPPEPARPSVPHSGGAPAGLPLVAPVQRSAGTDDPDRHTADSAAQGGPGRVPGDGGEPRPSEAADVQLSPSTTVASAPPDAPVVPRAAASPAAVPPPDGGGRGPAEPASNDHARLAGTLGAPGHTPPAVPAGSVGPAPVQRAGPALPQPSAGAGAVAPPVVVRRGPTAEGSFSAPGPTEPGERGALLPHAARAAVPEPPDLTVQRSVHPPPSVDRPAGPPVGRPAGTALPLPPAHGATSAPVAGATLPQTGGRVDGGPPHDLTPAATAQRSPHEIAPSAVTAPDAPTVSATSDRTAVDTPTAQAEPEPGGSAGVLGADGPPLAAAAGSAAPAAAASPARAPIPGGVPLALAAPGPPVSRTSDALPGAGTTGARVAPGAPVPSTSPSGVADGTAVHTAAGTSTALVPPLPWRTISPLSRSTPGAARTGAVGTGTARTGVSATAVQRQTARPGATARDRLRGDGTVPVERPLSGRSRTAARQSTVGVQRGTSTGRLSLADVAVVQPRHPDGAPALSGLTAFGAAGTLAGDGRGPVRTPATDAATPGRAHEQTLPAQSTTPRPVLTQRLEVRPVPGPLFPTGLTPARLLPSPRTVAQRAVGDGRTRRGPVAGNHRRGALALPPAASPAAAAADGSAGERPQVDPLPAAATRTVTVDELDAQVAPTAAAHSAPTGTLGMEPQQLARLADALYPRLLRQVRHEVLLDRERRGIRTDRRLP